MHAFLVLIILETLGARHREAPQKAQTVAAAIVRAADEHGLDPLLVATVARHESHFNPKAVSPDGRDRGLMQLRGGPGTRWAHVSRKQLHDTQTNLTLGAEFLANRIALCGTLPKALGAYNTGKCRVNRYARSVLSEYKQIRARATKHTLTSI